MIYLEPPSVTRLNSMDCFNISSTLRAISVKKFLPVGTKPLREFDQTLVFPRVWGARLDRASAFQKKVLRSG